MKQHIFILLLIVEGATTKKYQFIMSLKKIYKNNFCFDEEKYIFRNAERLKPEKYF